MPRELPDFKAMAEAAVDAWSASEASVYRGRREAIARAAYIAGLRRAGQHARDVRDNWLESGKCAFNSEYVLVCESIARGSNAVLGLILADIAALETDHA